MYKIKDENQNTYDTAAGMLTKYLQTVMIYIFIFDFVLKLLTFFGIFISVRIYINIRF